MSKKTGWESTGDGKSYEVSYPDGVDPNFFKAGERIKVTRKSLRFYTDNQWKRGVAKYYLAIFSVTLNRDYLPVVTKVTKKYIYQNSGRRYRLEFTIVGLALCLEWHAHNPKQERIAL